MQETFQVRRMRVAREIGRPQPWIFSAARHPAIRQETIAMTTSRPRLGSVFLSCLIPNFALSTVAGAWQISRNRRSEVSLAPLLSASPAIQLHAFAAMSAFVLGLVQLAAPKGTLPHRTLGWIWVVIMFVVAISSFFIHQLRIWGPWSPIHLISIFTLVMLPLGVWRARHHQVQRHRWTMISIFVGALVIAGLFTLVPGRIMHAVAFGP
jgi:uncharacterized membrane protein